MKWVDYREALGVSFSDADKARMLSAKISALLDEINDSNLPREGETCRRYFSDVGETNPGTYYAWYEVKRSIIKNKNIIGLISHIIAFSNAAKKEQMISLGNAVLKAIKVFLSDLKIDYELFEDNDGCFIFPKGASELDKANVNVPFAWLNAYPKARESMIFALKAYSNKEHPSQVADQFRKALETFLKEFFSNEVSLENQKKNVGGYLKESGVPKELVGNFETTLQMYSNYMNNYAKHNDGTQEKYLEFIMYQTGNIIRFIISLSQEE